MFIGVSCRLRAGARERAAGEGDAGEKSGARGPILLAGASLHSSRQLRPPFPVPTSESARRLDWSLRHVYGIRLQVSVAFQVGSSEEWV